VDELVKLVQEKAGLSEAQAKQAVETVVDYLKKRLPDPIAGQVDAVLDNEAVMGQASDAIDKGINRLGGMLGGKKGK
jgi:hypothetical protein